MIYVSLIKLHDYVVFRVHKLIKSHLGNSVLITNFYVWYSTVLYEVQGSNVADF